METTEKDLNQIPAGKTAVIVAIAGGGLLKKRLLELGITAGQSVQVTKSAPLDDPIEIKVRNSSLTLRREEARRVIVG